MFKVYIQVKFKVMNFFLKKNTKTKIKFNARV